MLTFDAVACARGGRLLWRGLTLHLGPGALVHARGVNGCGKSSLLRLAVGFLPPVAGSVHRSVAADLVDEGHGLDSERPLGRALGFWASIAGASPARVDEALARTGITHLYDVPVYMLSTGQKKRAALARLLIANTPLWLLDEPANGLDDDGMAMLEMLIADHRARGGAVILASHQPVAVADATQLTLAHYTPDIQ